jgi:hypothetical protein
MPSLKMHNKSSFIGTQGLHDDQSELGRHILDGGVSHDSTTVFKTGCYLIPAVHQDKLIVPALRARSRMAAHSILSECQHFSLVLPITMPTEKDQLESHFKCCFLAGVETTLDTTARAFGRRRTVTINKSFELCLIFVVTGALSLA